MSQNHTIGRHATTNSREDYQNSNDSYQVITYHSTQVVRFNRSCVFLNTGGYETVTTKLRMNQTANQYDLGYRVFQKDYTWYVEYNSKIEKFGNIGSSDIHKIDRIRQ